MTNRFAGQIEADAPLALSVAEIDELRDQRLPFRK
jgi:hypothetical protein